MIHVHANAGVSPLLAVQSDIPEEYPALVITISGNQDLQKLQALLNRSLNCAPEFGVDWFALSDRLDQFLTEQGISRTATEN